jgi:hypothetical protein
MSSLPECCARAVARAAITLKSGRRKICAPSHTAVIGLMALRAKLAFSRSAPRNPRRLTNIDYPAISSEPLKTVAGRASSRPTRAKRWYAGRGGVHRRERGGWASASANRRRRSAARRGRLMDEGWRGRPPRQARGSEAPRRMGEGLSRVELSAVIANPSRLQRADTSTQRPDQKRPRSVSHASSPTCPKRPRNGFGRTNPTCSKPRARQGIGDVTNRS